MHTPYTHLNSVLTFTYNNISYKIDTFESIDLETSVKNRLISSSDRTAVFVEQYDGSEQDTMNIKSTAINESILQLLNKLFHSRETFIITIKHKSNNDVYLKLDNATVVSPLFQKNINDTLKEKVEIEFVGHLNTIKY